MHLLQNVVHFILPYYPHYLLQSQRIDKDKYPELTQMAEEFGPEWRGLVIQNKTVCAHCCTRRVVMGARLEAQELEDDLTPIPHHYIDGSVDEKQGTKSDPIVISDDESDFVVPPTPPRQRKRKRPSLSSPSILTGKRARFE